MRHLIQTLVRLHPLQRVAVFIWFALLIGVTGRVLFAPLRSHTVVPIYLTAAERWQRSEPLYVELPRLDVYRNPPGIAAAFIPLTWLPERLAGLLWRALGVTLFLVGLGRMVRDGLPRPLTPGESGAVFSLAVIPAIPSISNGQTNMIIIGALLLGATAAARLPGPSQTRAVPPPTRGRWTFAIIGSWLTIATAVKVYPAAVGLLIGLVNRYRVYPWFFAGCAVCFAFPYLLQTPGYVSDEYENFAVHVVADDRTWAALTRAPQDLFLAFRVWAAPPMVEIYLLAKLAAAAGMAGLVGLALRQTRNPREVVPLGFHLGCIWVTVLGPATEIPTYVLLGPTAASVAVLGAADRRTLGGRIRFGLAGLGYGLMILPIVRDMLPNGKPFHALALPPIGGALVLMSVIWSGARMIWAGTGSHTLHTASADRDETSTEERRPPCPTDRAA
jgi:hypothetical protein